MKCREQSDKISIINFDKYIRDSDSVVMKKRHSKLLPDNIRCLIVGPSNCGKTNAIFNLLFDPNGLRFTNVYVFSKSLYQPKYKFLEDVLTDIDGIGYHPFTDNDKIVPPEDALSDSVMIFDDVICEKQNNITKYFSMGRHSNIDVFYLGQTYSRIPKQLVRDNANLLLVFRQDERNLRHIFNDHVSPDMTYEVFRSLCEQAWSRNKKGFLTIDKERDKNKGRYRYNFDFFVGNL